MCQGVWPITATKEGREDRTCHEPVRVSDFEERVFRASNPFGSGQFLFSIPDFCSCDWPESLKPCCASLVSTLIRLVTLKMEPVSSSEVLE
jgi:hypothetical protein